MSNAEEDGPVTVSVARRIRAGKEAAYEQWVHQVIATASTFPGHMGVDVLKPSPGTRGEYVIVNRFDNYSNQRNWEESPERAKFLEELEPIALGDTRISKVSGLEFWFSLPEVPVSAAPNRHKMALVLSVVVFALVLGVNVAFDEWLQLIPLVPRIAVVAVAQVVLLTYVVMPRVTAVLKDWLYPC